MEEVGRSSNISTKDSAKKVASCDVEALKKCLEENKGDQSKCLAQIQAFKTSCSTGKPKNPSSDST